MAGERLIEVISPQSFEEIEKLRKELVASLDVTSQWAKELKSIKLPSDVKKSYTEAASAIKLTQQAIDKYQRSVEKNRLAELKLSQDREKAFDRYDRQLQKEKAAREAQVNKESQLRERLANQRKAEEAAIASANQKRAEAARKLTVLYEKELFDARQLKMERKEMAILSSKLATEYQKQEVKLTQLRRAYKELAIQQQLHGNLTKAQVAEMKRLELQANKIDTALKNVDKAVGQSQRNVGNYSSALNGLKGTFTSLIGAFGITSGVMIFAQLMRGAITTVKEFDSGLKNVQKTTGLNSKATKELGDEIINLSRNLGTVGTKKLLEYATVAGQLGVKGTQDIMNFTEALAKLETASDITGEQGGASIARLLTLTDGGVQNIADFGDEIVKLGNNFAATENEILGNATAIAQNTGIYKLARQQVLAYATATKAVGIESEITGSTIGKTLGLIEKSLRTGQGIEAIVSLTGRNIDELKELFKKDSGAVFTELLKGLNNVDKAGGSVNEQLEQLGITAVRDQRVIGSLATAGYDTLARAMRDVADASGSLNEEFELASSKLENQFNRIGIAWDNLILSLESGEGFISRTLIKGFGILANHLDTLSDILGGNYTFWEKWGKGIKLAFSYMNFGSSIFSWFNSETEKLGESVDKATKSIEKQNKAFIEQHGSLAPLTELQAEYLKNQKEINILTGEGAFESSSDGFGKQSESIKELQQRIADLNSELLDLDKTDKEGIKTKQEQIQLLQKELDAILGTNKAKQAAKKLEPVKNSLDFFNDLIRKQEDVRDRTAKTNTEYETFNRNIAKLKYEVSFLTGEYRKLLKELQQPINIDLKKNASEGLNKGTDTSELEAENAALIKNAALRAKKKQDAIFAAKQVEDAFVRLGLTIGLQEDTVRNLFDGIKDGFADVGEAAEAFGALANDVLRTISASQAQRSQEQIERLEKQKEIELAFAGDSAAAREEIEARYQKRVAEEKRKAAIAERRAAIATSIINTAVAVVKTFATLGFPAGIAAAAIVAGLGLAETAIIANQPIPQFKDGVKNFEGGKAIVGDGGKHEPITDRHGKLIGISPKKSTLVDLPKGSNVYKDMHSFENEMNAILGGNGISPLGNAISTPLVVFNGSSQKGMNASEMRKIMRETLGSMPKNVMNIDQNGINVYAQKQYGKGKSLNNRTTFKGIDV